RDVRDAQEACPLNRAATARATATLALGDALAVALLEARGFTANDFARSHPGGSLGRRLLLHVADLMHSGAAVPAVTPDTLLSDALLEMTRKGLGMTAVVDNAGKVLGIYTDGDLRRTLDRQLDVHKTSVAEAMTRDCKTAPADMLAGEALAMMDKHKINALLIVDENNILQGALNMHDLLRAGII